MQITIFGASGKVGRLVCQEAVKRGHCVIACVHANAAVIQPLQMSYPDALYIRQCDIRSAEDVAQAIGGSSVVISTLGSWGTKDKNIVSTATRRIIPAMQEAGIDRIITLTGTEALCVGEKPAFWRKLTRMAAKVVARRILQDGEDHLNLLSESTLDWTSLRSPVMTNSNEVFYRLTLTPTSPWQTIPRKAVAKALVDQAEGPGYSRAAPIIYRLRSRF